MCEQLNNQKEKTPASGKYWVKIEKDNAIYTFLKKTLTEQGEKNKNLIKFEDEIFKSINQFSDDEQDIICDIVFKYENFILKILSECPYISININNQNNGVK